MWGQKLLEEETDDGNFRGRYDAVKNAIDSID